MIFLNKTTRLLETKPIFLFLVPFYVLIHLEKIFHNLINYRFAYMQILFMMLASALIILISLLCARNKNKAWLLSLLLMLSWFYLGLIKNWLYNKFPDSFFGSYTFFLPASLVLIFLSILVILRYNGSFFRFFLFINSLWLIFILIDIIAIVASETQQPFFQNKYVFNLPKSQVPDSLKPDIYYIVFDSYSSSQILRKMGFDNHRIEEELEGSGFKIVQNASSNYNLTPFSIASTLNMKYLDEADTGKKYFLDGYFPIVKAVTWNGMAPWLRDNGYHFVNYSIFDFPGQPSINKAHDVWDIEEVFIQHNLALKIYIDLYFNLKLRSYYSGVKLRNAINQRDAYDDSVFHKLLLAAPGNELTVPRFIYAHFFMPHSPNSYDSSGRKIPVDIRYSRKEKEKLYTDEILFVNSRIRIITDSLLLHARRPLVIIIQGDHGYRFWDNSRKKDEFQNFFAIYFSNRNYSEIPDTLTNVNLFRTVLNTHFKMKIPYEVNRHYFLRYH